MILDEKGEGDMLLGGWVEERELLLRPPWEGRRDTGMTGDLVVSSALASDDNAWHRVA